MILDDILARKRAELEARKRARPIDALEAAAASRPAPRPLAKALRRSGEIGDSWTWGPSPSASEVTS